MADVIIRQEQNALPPPYSLVDDAATQLLQTFETNLAAMTIEELGTKIRENGIKIKVFKPGQSKTGRLTLLIDAFNKYCNDIKNMNRAELFDICRDNKISGYSGLKKDELVQIILELTASCKQIKFADKVADKVADNKSTDNKVAVADNKSTDKKMTVADNTTDSNAFISELELMKKKLDDQIEKEKERVEKERVEKERVEKEKERVEKENLKLEQERLKAEKAQKDKAEQQKVKAEQKDKAEQQKVKADTQIISDEDPEKKKKKQTIPKSVKTHVWDLYIGKHINEHRCLCCKKSYIQITNFDTGHVLSEKDGGTHEISNLRPICAVCNHSMGSENMIDFVKRYGYYIG